MAKIKEKITSFIKFLPILGRESVFFIKFLILLFFAFWSFVFDITPKKHLNKPRRRLIKLDFLKKFFDGIYAKVIRHLDSKKENEIKTSDLILLAMKNLSAKKNRTYVTMAGMCIGFGAVILLLSIGYGFERLVISQVASLSEMKQIDVTTSQGSLLTFNNELLMSICDMEEVDEALPIITTVSKVEYNNAVSDVITYGVTTRFLEETGLKPLKGEIFDETPEKMKSLLVLGESTNVQTDYNTTLISSNSFGQEIYDIYYSIHPMIWKPVYSEPSTKSRILGYTKREVGDQDAVEVWGSVYDSLYSDSKTFDYKGNEYARWVRDDFPLWEKKVCDMKNPDCIEKNYLVRRNGVEQYVTKGYISEDNVSVERYRVSKSSDIDMFFGKVVDSVDIKLGKENKAYFDPNVTSKTVSVFSNDELIIEDTNLLYGDVYESAQESFVVEGDKGLKMGYWVKADITVYGDTSCENVCDQYYIEQRDGVYKTVNLEVFFKASEVEIIDAQVLGEDSRILGATGDFIDLKDVQDQDDSIDWAQLASELGGTGEVSKDIKKIPDTAQKVAVVNTAMLNMLGIEESSAVGESFTSTFIFDSKLFGKSNYLAESEPTSFEIIGVVSDARPPAFYVPITDIRVDGVENVSSMKVVIDDTKDLDTVRKHIESLGFQTSSVVDTVQRIGDLFNVLRIALLSLGLIALGVASLGMFNTLTVSLLEKTREVGLLKTMGLKSREVKILFLAESIIMSVTGGVAGVLFGFGVGKIISLLISILAVSQGQSVLDVSYVPWQLAFGTIFLASIVGIVTGWYPAVRATKVEALNALRYE